MWHMGCKSVQVCVVGINSLVIPFEEQITCNTWLVSGSQALEIQTSYQSQWSSTNSIQPYENWSDPVMSHLSSLEGSEPQGWYEPTITPDPQDQTVQNIWCSWNCILTDIWDYDWKYASLGEHAWHSLWLTSLLVSPTVTGGPILWCSMTTGSKYHRKGSEVWRWFWAVMRKLWSPCMHSYMVWVSQNCIWNNQVIIYPSPFSRLPRPFLQTNVWCPQYMLPTPLAWKTAAEFALCWRGKHSGVSCLCHPYYPVYLTNLIMLHIVTLHSLTHYCLHT